MIFRAGSLKTISLRAERAAAGKGAILVAAEGRIVAHTGFKRLLILDASIVEQRDGTLWLLTEGAVEGEKED